MRCRILLVTFMSAILLFLATPTPGQCDDLRTWKDSTGQFSVKARFFSQKDDVVTLINEAGKRVAIPLDRLSESDRKHVKSLMEKAAENPFKTVEEKNPFQPVEASGGELKVVEVDLAQAREVLGVPKEAEWRFEPPAAVASNAKYQPVRTGPKKDFWEKFQGIAVSVPSGKALFGYALANKTTKKVGSRYVLSSFVDGTSKEYQAPELDSSMACMALSDDGHRAVMRRNDWGFGKSDFLELWSFGEKEITRQLKWVPYPKSKGGNRDVKMVSFLPEDRILTVSSGGRVVVWNANTAEPIYHLEIKGGSYPGISPNRKLLCYSKGEDIGVLDLDSGQVLAARRVGTLTWPSLRFDPTGSKVACMDHSRLRVYDFTSGELLIDMARRGFGHGGYRFVDKDHILVSGSTLVDVKNQLAVWSYQNVGAAEEFGAYTCLLTKGGNSSGLLMLAKLPQQEVTDALAQALESEDFWVLSKGTTVKLNVDGLPDADAKETVRTALTKQLAEAGIQVGQNGNIELIASIEEKKEKKKVSYSVGFGPIPPSPFSRGGLKYEVKEFVSHLKYVYNGEVAWSSSGNNIPGSFRLKDGDTIEKLLRRHEKPNYDWFGQIELPVLLRKPTGSATLGVSKFTSSGLR